MIDSSSPRSRQSPNLAENGLEVPQIVNQVREDDYLKFLAQTNLMGVALNKVELWMSLRGSLDHLPREIYTNPKGWP
jgi:hypothetical protein